MTYTKPELNILGDATRVIQSIAGKPDDQVFDLSEPTRPSNPAYDLDE